MKDRQKCFSSEETELCCQFKLCVYELRDLWWYIPTLTSKGQPFFSATEPISDTGWAKSGVKGPLMCGFSCKRLNGKSAKAHSYRKIGDFAQAKTLFGLFNNKHLFLDQNILEKNCTSTHNKKGKNKKNIQEKEDETILRIRQDAFRQETRITWPFLLVKLVDD